MTELSGEAEGDFKRCFWKGMVRAGRTAGFDVLGENNPAGSADVPFDCVALELPD